MVLGGTMLVLCCRHDLTYDCLGIDLAIVLSMAMITSLLVTTVGAYLLTMVVGRYLLSRQ